MNWFTGCATVEEIKAQYKKLARQHHPDLGGDTADIFQRACVDAHERFKPAAILVGASCTAELLQDNPAGLAAASAAR